MKNYQYILLDWDGNLAKTLDLWLDVFRRVLAERGYYPSDQEISASFGKVSIFFRSLGIDDAEALYEKADEIGKARLPDVELYPDALEVLEYFKQKNKQTAIITSSRRMNINSVFEKYKIQNLFDAVIAREDVKNQKPDPESLNKALELLGGNAEQAVIIGDSDKDILAGINAGVDSILFYPPEHKKFYDIEKLKQHKPTYIVEDFRQIMQIIT